MINSRTDKRVNNEGKDISKHTLANSPKASQEEVGAWSEFGDVILENEGAIKCDTQVTDGGYKGEVRKSMREYWKVKFKDVE